jgi:phosphoenolpyruvate carboxykinase (ATP)
MLKEHQPKTILKEAEGLPTMHVDLPITVLLQKAGQRNEGKFTKDGALVVRTQPTGRSAKDKLIVPSTQKVIWFGPVNNEISAENFLILKNDVCQHLKEQPELFIQNVYLGAGKEKKHVRFVTTKAWNAAFVDRLYIVPAEKEKQKLQQSEPDLTIFHAPHFKADPEKHKTISDKAIALDFDRKEIIIAGTQYGGETKKAGFSYMNGEMPGKNILPMHCSAIITQKGETAVFFGLSGTGKTTLSSDEGMTLIGDDEHGWGPNGIFNFEGGCYPKVIKLNQDSEPKIWDATNRHGSLMENVIISSDGTPDFHNISLTENTRSAFTLQEDKKWSGKAGHPKNILFLTADASGILPPIAQLTKEQAQFYFISGYTSKVAGTEQGVIQPEPTFSACFGEPFLPLHPSLYAKLLSEKVSQQEEKGNQVNIWMVNTGWNGNAYDKDGVFNPDKRMSLKLTRALVKAVVNGDLDHVEKEEMPIFGLQIPKICPGVNPENLNPQNSWIEKILYEKNTNKLAQQFNNNFQKYKKHVPENVKQAAPRGNI